MMKFLISMAIFIVLVVIQTGFIASLPAPLLLTPLLLAVSVYLIQHHGLYVGAYWLALYGVWLDIFGVGTAPVETLAYTLAAVAALWGSRRFFSNRSVYGILACGLAAELIITLVHAITISLVWFKTPASAAWTAFFASAAWTVFLMFVLLVILFQFAKSIRTGLLKSFLISRTYETY